MYKKLDNDVQICSFYFCPKPEVLLTKSSFETSRELPRGREREHDCQKFNKIFKL